MAEKLQTSCVSWLLCYCNHIHDKLDELLHLPLELFHTIQKKCFMPTDKVFIWRVGGSLSSGVRIGDAQCAEEQ